MQSDARTNDLCPIDLGPNSSNRAVALRKPAAAQELTAPPRPAGRELCVPTRPAAKTPAVTLPAVAASAGTEIAVPSPGGTHELTAPQCAAIDGLVAGMSVTAAASAAGVDRTTLHGWLRKNYAFQAALARARADFRQGITQRLQQLASDATDCVLKAVREGDVKAALELVKRMQLLPPLPVQSDDPLELQIEEEEAQQKLERREEQVRDERALCGLLGR